MFEFFYVFKEMSSEEYEKHETFAHPYPEKEPIETEHLLEYNLSRSLGIGPYFRLGLGGVILTALTLTVLGLCKNCKMSYIPAVILFVGCMILIWLHDMKTAKSAAISGLLILIIGMSLSAGNVC